MNKLNIKWGLTGIAVAVAIALALIGGNWKLGQAATIPTIPSAISYSPHQVIPGTGFILTVNGANFNQLPNIGVRWIVPGTNINQMIPPDSVSLNGTQLKVTIPAQWVNPVGLATFQIVNNPSASDAREVTGPLPVKIGTKLYLPTVRK